VRKKLADGTVKEYRYPPQAKRHRKKVIREHGAIRQLAELYVKSPEFLRLSALWQERKKYYLGILEDDLDWMTIDHLNDRRCRGEFYEVRDKLADTPSKADKLIDTLKGLLSWAYERNRISYNHAVGIPHLAPSGKIRNEHIWTEDHEAIVYAGFPPAMVTAFRFALFSAMRQADMCALKWESYKDGWISYQPSKTSGSSRIWVHLPVFALPPFHALVESLPRRSEFMLLTETGKPLIAQTLAVRWRFLMAKTDLRGVDLTWHDIRGTAATRLLEAGGTDAEVAAITGHSIGGGSKLGDYAARSKQLALNAYQKWSTRLEEKPAVIHLDNRRR
jgi:integrase